MQQLITLIEASLEDEILSKSEKRSLKEALKEQPLDEQQKAFVRSKLFDLAMERASPDNYGRIIAWLEEANKALALVKPGVQTMHQSFFSPGNSCRDSIIYQLRQAKRQIDICVFTISDNAISKVIYERYQQHVPIRIITDNDKLHDAGSDIAYLARKGLEIRIDETSNHMHHKYALIDSHTLLTGSYNWTRSAALYNHENLLLTSEHALVGDYQKEFNRLWTEMIPFTNE